MIYNPCVDPNITRLFSREKLILSQPTENRRSISVRLLFAIATFISYNILHSFIGGSMTKKSSSEKSRLRRAISRQVYRSHERLLEEALEQTPEVTDLEQLRAKYPQYDEEKLLRLQRLNQKINQANDFLIEEQSAWLDPSSRPTGGIPYNEQLFGKPFASESDNAEDIQNQVYDETK